MGARKDDEVRDEGEELPDDAEGHGSDADDADDEDAGAPADDPTRVTRDELRAFLSRPEVLARARTIVGLRAPEQDVNDLVDEAVASALGKKTMPRRASVQPWFDRVVRRRIADRYRKRARREPYEGPMPQAPAILDEAGEPVDDPGDAVVDVDPSVDPTEPDFHAEGWLLRRWMSRAVSDDANDRETWAIMEQLADADDDAKVTYKQLAEHHGLTEAQLYKRIERLKAKYGERYEKWRNGFFLLLALGAFVLVAAVAAWLLRPRGEDIQRDWGGERAPRLAPSASASASAGPPDTPFEPALPPSTRPTTPPKPPAPPRKPRPGPGPVNGPPK